MEVFIILMLRSTCSCLISLTARENVPEKVSEVLIETQKLLGGFEELQPYVRLEEESKQELNLIPIGFITSFQLQIPSRLS